MFIWKTRKRDEDGASAVEYGLLIAGIAGIVVIAVFAFGGSVQNLFKTSCTTFADTNAQHGGLGSSCG